MARLPALPQPTHAERDGMRARSLEDAYAGWSEVQRAIYLAVWRGHARRSEVAGYLGRAEDEIARELDAGMSGYLLWEQAEPDPTLHIK